MLIDQITLALCGNSKFTRQVHWITCLCFIVCTEFWKKSLRLPGRNEIDRGETKHLTKSDMRTSHFSRSIPSVKTHLRNLQVLNQYLCDFLCCEERFQVEKMRKNELQDCPGVVNILVYLTVKFMEMSQLNSCKISMPLSHVYGPFRFAWPTV